MIYRRIVPTFWTGTTGRAIREAGAEAQLLALYLLTSPHATMLGLYRLPAIFAAHDTGIPVARVRKALAALGGIGFAHHDAASEHVWVVEMARFQMLGDLEQLSPGDNQAKAAARAYAELPDNPFLGAFHDRYGVALGLGPRRGTPSEAPPKPLPTPFEGGKARSHQDQEQAQAQEQHQEQPQAQDLPAPAGAVAEVVPTDPLLVAIREAGIPAWTADPALTPAWAAAQRRAFPGLDLEHETRQAASWWLSHPSRTKSRKGGAKFLASTWFARAHETRRPPRTAAPIAGAGARFDSFLAARAVGNGHT